MPLVFQHTHSRQSVTAGSQTWMTLAPTGSLIRMTPATTFKRQKEVAHGESGINPHAQMLHPIASTTRWRDDSADADEKKLFIRKLITPSPRSRRFKSRNHRSEEAIWIVVFIISLMKLVHPEYH